MLLRRLHEDVEAYERDEISLTELNDRTDIKLGESGNFPRRRKEYKLCEAMYELTWIAHYSTPTRKLTGAALLFIYFVSADTFQRDLFMKNFAKCGPRPPSPCAPAGSGTANGSSWGWWADQMALKTRLPGGPPCAATHTGSKLLCLPEK